MAQLVKRENWVQSLGWTDRLEKGKATPVFWPGEFRRLYSPWGCLLTGETDNERENKYVCQKARNAVKENKDEIIL